MSPRTCAACGRTLGSNAACLSCRDAAASDTGRDGATSDAGSAVRFRAVGSDPDAGDALSYAWDFGDGGTGAGHGLVRRNAEEDPDREGGSQGRRPEDLHEHATRT